jgi:hypothetical protein
LPEGGPRRLVGLRVLRAHRQADGAEPARRLAHRPLARPDLETPPDRGLGVEPPPAHHAVGLGSPLHDRRQLGFLLRREARLPPRSTPVAPAGAALGVVAAHG